MALPGGFGQGSSGVTLSRNRRLWDQSNRTRLKRRCACGWFSFATTMKAIRK